MGQNLTNSLIPTLKGKTWITGLNSLYTLLYVIRNLMSKIISELSNS